MIKKLVLILPKYQINILNYHMSKQIVCAKFKILVCFVIFLNLL